MYQNLFAQAEWWVVYVRSVGQPVGCYYGGSPRTVARWVDEHAGWAGPVEELVPHPFASGHDSLVARAAMEERLYARAA